MKAALAGWLGLAAAPTFAVMAVAAGVVEARSGVLMCGPGASPVSGMGVMYALMAAFHLGPWLRLSSERRRSSQ